MSKRKSVATKPTASIWIKADGTKTEVYPSGEKWSLEELQAKVGGYIELVPKGTHLNDNMILVVNEEGLLQGLPRNSLASFVARRPIVGDALIVPKGQLE